MAQGKKDEAEEAKAQVRRHGARELADSWKPWRTELEREDQQEDDGHSPDHRRLGSDRQGRQRERGDRKASASRLVPDFEVPYHIDIMERLNGVRSGQLPASTSGNGFYYLKRRYCPAALGDPVLCAATL